ncbi:MAG: undecaprenyl-diphosphatase [Candidatus Binatia bacterium]|jgi:undecaprenyl-diphosphatase
MPEWLQVIILGIIEGVTEFLPISSTGHLLIAQQWLDRQSEAFNVAIQSGAMLAVIVIFRERVMELITKWREPESRDYTLKLILAFVITGVGGVALKAAGFELPETAAPIGWALLVGGVLFLVVENRLKTRELADHISWKLAALIGVGQLAAAVFSGLSRSGATILVALVLGLNRKRAIEFTFLLGVPTMFAAGGLELALEVKDNGFAGFDWGMLILGTVVSAVTAFVSVKWLLKFVQTHTFEAFGWYRIAVGGAVLLFLR